MVRRSARGGQVTPEAHKFRQRRTGYVPTQSGRTRFRPRRSHRLVLSANIGMILRTQTPSAIGGHAHTDSFGQQRQKFYLVVGQAMRRRRTSYAGGAQVQQRQQLTKARESYTFFVLIDMMQAPK
jgi:hypothetical protein